MTIPTITRRLVAVAALAFAGAVALPAAPAAAWDEANIPLACGQKSTLTLTNGQSAASRFDNVGKTSATVIVFLDASKQELEGHALRHHYSSTGPLKVVITTTKVTVSGPDCPPPPPPVIELPCNEQWKHAYNPQTEIVKGRVDPNDRHVYLVTVLDKKTLREVAHYAIHGSCAQDQFRLTVQKAKGIIDVHDGPRGKKA